MRMADSFTILDCRPIAIFSFVVSLLEMHQQYGRMYCAIKSAIGIFRCVTNHKSQTRISIKLIRHGRDITNLCNRINFQKWSLRRPVALLLAGMTAVIFNKVPMSILVRSQKTTWRKASWGNIRRISDTNNEDCTPYCRDKWQCFGSSPSALESEAFLPLSQLRSFQYPSSINVTERAARYFFVNLPMHIHVTVPLNADGRFHFSGAVS